MRRTTTLAALLLGTTLLTPTGLATAVGETCRGEAATIVGTELPVVGTQIKINGTDLGSGADTLHGGPTRDDVKTSGYDSESGQSGPDTERDVVDTGAGVDRVASPSDTATNPDVITTGPGTDYLYVVGPLAVGGRLDGGTDGARLETRIDAGALVVDSAAGTSTLDGRDWLRWDNIGALGFLVDRVDVTYTGSPANEALDVGMIYGATGHPSVTAELGAGDDRLTLMGVGPFGRTSIDAGTGRDTVEVNGIRSVDADLGAEIVRWGDVTSDLVGVENVSAYGTDVRVIGDDAANVLSVGGCTTRAVGGKGADTLERWRGQIEGPRVQCAAAGMAFSGGPGNDRLDGSGSSDVLRGGAGKDRLIGREGNDTLLGGSGRDKASGGPGRDRCKTEVEKSCER